MSAQLAESFEIDLPDLDQLATLEYPGARILVWCEWGRAWLELAGKNNQIRDLVRIERFFERLLDYAEHGGIEKGICLTVEELLRRSERAVGVHIQKGQSEGWIARKGQNIRYRANGKDVTRDLITVAEATGIPRKQRGMMFRYFALAQGISDEQFEKAIEQGIHDRKLGRIHVEQRCRGEEVETDPWDQLPELVAAGNTSSQIAKIIGVGREQVRRRALALNLDIHADKVVRNSRFLNQDRILREFVATLESLVPSCDLISPAGLTPGAIEECVAIFTDAMRSLRKLERRLKKGKPSE